MATTILSGAQVSPSGEPGSTGAARWSGLCGRLGITSSPSNTISFVPYNGNLIKIAGSIYNIPSAGVSAIANNLYLNGVGGSSLAANTLYNIYVFDNAGTLTLDFSTTTHVTSSTAVGMGAAGNIGVEIKSGDDTRSFVGFIRASSTAPSSNSFYDQYRYRNIASWFNRLPISFSWSDNMLIGTYLTNMDFQFVLFKGDSVTAMGTWYGTANGVDNHWLRLLDGPSGSYAEASASSPHSGSEFINIFVSKGGVATEDNFFVTYFQSYSQSGFTGNGIGSMITNIQYAHN